MAIARFLATVDCIGLANILLGHRKVMPELVQEDCTLDGILAHLAPLLQGGDEARAQRDEFANLRQRLSDKDPAPEVARMAINMAENQAGGNRLPASSA
jgi:lipid-A-disaccharide synthase